MLSATDERTPVVAIYSQPSYGQYFSLAPAWMATRDSSQLLTAIKPTCQPLAFEQWAT